MPNQPEVKPTSIVIPMERILNRLRAENDQLRFSVMCAEETNRVIQEENTRLKAALTDADREHDPSTKSE